MTAAEKTIEVRARKRLYYLANKETLKAAARAWHLAHPERTKEIGKTFREKNREKNRLRAAARLAANPNLNKDYYARHQAELIQKAAARAKANPERKREIDRRCRLKKKARLLAEKTAV